MGRSLASLASPRSAESLSEASTRSKLYSNRSRTKKSIADDEETKEEERAPMEGATLAFHKEEEEEEDGDDDDDLDTADDLPKKRVYKSSRLNGYLLLLLTSYIHYNEAWESNDIRGLIIAVPASHPQRNYALTASMVTMVLCVVSTFAHLDRFTPLRKFWEIVYKPKSRIELCIITFLIVWWLVATAVQTSVRGIAGDGKLQYNLYLTTWSCFFITLWMMEKWIVSCGYSSFNEFMAAWPNRSPGWLVLFFLSLADLVSILDLYLYWNRSGNPRLKEQFAVINDEQWEWLLFVCAITVTCAAVFVLVEIFRETKKDEESSSGSPMLRVTFGVQKNYVKSEWETILEGVVLVLLVLAWIPSVIVATTPGGVASLIGNSYFFTWGSVVFVMETGVWWIHDWRKRIHSILEQQDEEYRRVKQEVLEQSNMKKKRRGLTGTTVLMPTTTTTTTTSSSMRHDDDDDDDDMMEDDVSIYSDYDGLAIPNVVG